MTDFALQLAQLAQSAQLAQQSWILDVLSGLSSLCLVLMQMWVLPTRNPRRFLAVGALLAVATVLMRPTLGLIPNTLPVQFLRTLLGVVLTFFAWPYTQWVAKRATRLIMCALLVVHMLVFELAYLAVSGLWYGGVSTDYANELAHLPQSVALHVGLCVLLVATTPMLRVFARQLDTAPLSRTMFGFVGFLLAEFALLCSLATLTPYLGDDWRILVGAIAVVLLFVTATALLGAVMLRHADAVRRKLRADEERRRLQAVLGEYQRMSDSAESAAKARHDLRNQLSVVLALASNGGWRDAQRQLDAMCATYRLDGCDDDGGDDGSSDDDGGGDCAAAASGQYLWLK